MIECAIAWLASPVRSAIMTAALTADELARAKVAGSLSWRTWLGWPMPTGSSSFRGGAKLSEIDMPMADICREMGFKYYVVVQHIDIRMSSTAGSVWLENYPVSWADGFVSAGLYSSDPFHIASQRNNGGGEALVGRQ